MPTFEGGCVCGAVRYSLATAPAASMICHCRTCQRVSGAPIVAWVGLAEPDFSFCKGAPRRVSTSPGVTREFCGACGTPLTYRTATEPHAIDVTTASLDDPNAFPPTHHSWTSHAIAWLCFDDGRPRFAGSRDDGEVA